MTSRAAGLALADGLGRRPCAAQEQRCWPGQQDHQRDQPGRYRHGDEMDREATKFSAASAQLPQAGRQVVQPKRRVRVVGAERGLGDRQGADPLTGRLL